MSLQEIAGPLCGETRNGAALSPRCWADANGKLVTHHADELHPHPSYVRHRIAVPVSQLSALAELGDIAFRDPLIVTRDGTILDGYARLELARLQGRATLNCIQYDLTEEEALQCLVQRHCRLNGLNPFCRILLALELEPWLRRKALSNQRAGGQTKGLSKLTEADRVDVRSGIAHAAGVSVGNVNKVKQLMTSAHPELLEALRSGEIRIHRAWKWSKLALQGQIETLRVYRNRKGLHKTIRQLVSRHESRTISRVSDLARLISLSSALNSGELSSVSVSVIKATGKAVYVTEGLVEALGAQEELAYTCATTSH